jgi:hypothetical protein
MSTGYTEDALIEKPAISLFELLKWDTAKCDTIYQHVYDSYLDGTHGIYAAAV